MIRTPSPGRLELRASLFPALQSILTAVSTMAGVLLVAIWRSDRARHLPFYSDATQNDPERVFLAMGENLACFFMPLVATVEYLQQSRLAATYTYPKLPRWLVRSVIKRVTSRHIALLNFWFSLLTTVFFFLTANLPTKPPFLRPHQFSASALIFVYAVQATCKAVLAATFGNYDPAFMALDVEGGSGSERSNMGYEKVTAHDVQSVAQSSDPKEGRRSGWKGVCAGWWARNHIKIRVAMAGILWVSLGATWVCFVTRKLLRGWGGDWEKVRYGIVLGMAGILYVTTAACVGLMAVLAVDLRHEVVVLGGR